MKTLLNFCLLLSFSFSVVAQERQDVFDHLVICNQDVIVQNAVTDLQRYLSQVMGTVPTLLDSDDWKKNPVPAIIIGDISSLKKLLPAHSFRPQLGREGYVLQEIKHKENACFLIYADQSNGLVNSIYGFLRELGFEFNLGSEVVPAILPFGLSVSVIEHNPIFNVRGVLPWYNFFNSPTSWDVPDHRAFIDQLIRSGANFITFHSYEHEPFIAVEENGTMIFGEGLRNTKLPTWGTNSMTTSEFMYGTDQLFDTPYFGAETTLQGYDRSTQIKKEKAILREALLYAKNRGLTTSIGFAPLGDPTLKADRERFIQEFTHNLDYYSFVDYIFIWQTETKGAQGHPLKYDTHVLPDARDPNSKIVNYGEYRRNIFKRIVDKESGIQPFFKSDEEGKIARATEGARLEMFAKIALRILSRYENPPKIVISGWGGENYLLSEEYYEGLDKVLPQDVAFSSLESLTPKTYIDKAYFDLPTKRQRWPIPWLENDGDQWHPQPFLKTYEPMIKDLQKSGSQGFLGIHWRTREVEDNFAYLLSYAWNPSITKESFFETKAKKYAGVARELKRIYLELDSLGYRWVGGRGQNECAIFTWGSGSVTNYQKLWELRNRLEAILPFVKQDKDNLIWLRDRMDWVLDYQKAEIQAETARDLLKKAEETTDENERKIFAKRAFGILSGDALAKAMHSYAERITTRGEYGVMATINTKAAFDWKKMFEKSCEILGVSLEIDNKWNPDPRIIVPRIYGSCEPECDFELKTIILGGQPAFFKYRNLGNHLWKEKEFTTTENWVQSVTIPASEIVQPGFEYMIQIGGDTVNIYGPKAVSVIQTVDLPLPLVQKKSIENQQLKNISVKQDKKMNVIEWDDVPLADYYELIINGNAEVETPVPFYPYPEKIQKGTSIVVKAIQNGQVISEISKK
jgi:hypothetical protein